ncbi:MAG: hypothetical protein AAGI46_00095 [Planctomycetota bacterium]
MSSNRQDVNVGLVAFVGVVGTMVLLIIVLGVQAWFGFESDLIVSQRYGADDNVDWRRLKSEQYANIGDPIGNDTIYASETAPPTRFSFAMGEERQDYLIGEGAAEGYRFLGEERDQLVVPIHLAMAAVVAERGGPSISRDDMLALDEGRNYYVTLVNKSYNSPESTVEIPTRRPSTRPAETPMGQSAAHPNGSETSTESSS